MLRPKRSMLDWKPLMRWQVLGSALLCGSLVLVPAGCESENDVSESVEEAGDEIEEAAEEVKDEIDDATDDG